MAAYVVAEVEVTDPATYEDYRKLLKSGDFEAGFVGWSADFNDASTFLYVLQSTTVNSGTR